VAQVIQAPTSSALPALRISNSATTSGVHSLVVGDAVNPDISSFVIDNNGNVGIGVDPATWSPNSKLELNGGIKFTVDSSVQTTAYTPSNVAITGGSINNITIDGGTY
jgi:predicted metal-dependent TIM-barrel fold hydrolase